MAQQILPAIDFRGDETSTQQTIQAIGSILGTIGSYEKKRREKQTLERITRAIAGGSTTVEAIASASEQDGAAGIPSSGQVGQQSSLQSILSAIDQKPEFDTGIRGGLQRFSGLFQGQSDDGIGSSVKQAILGQALQKALSPKPLLTRAEQVEGAKIKAGLKPRAGQVKPKDQQNDLDIIGDDEKSEVEKVRARERIDKDPKHPRNPMPTGDNYDELLSSKDKVNGKFGAKAYNTVLKKLEDAARREGFDPKQAKKEIDRWWDARVKNERSGALGGAFTRNVTTPRAEFQETTEQSEEIKDMSQLSDEELLKIAQGK